MGEFYKDPHRYDDIIDLPHHQSKVRPHMLTRDRAAQFAPFAALTGHGEAIEETARAAEEKNAGILREDWEASDDVQIE